MQPAAACASRCCCFHCLMPHYYSTFFVRSLKPFINLFSLGNLNPGKQMLVVNDDGTWHACHPQVRGNSRILIFFNDSIFYSIKF